MGEWPGVECSPGVGGGKEEGDSSECWGGAALRFGEEQEATGWAKGMEKSPRGPSGLDCGYAWGFRPSQTLGSILLLLVYWKPPTSPLASNPDLFYSPTWFSPVCVCLKQESEIRSYLCSRFSDLSGVARGSAMLPLKIPKVDLSLPTSCPPLNSTPTVMPPPD